MRDDIKLIKSTPSVNIRRYIKILASCSIASGRQFRDNYTNNWYLNQLEPKNKKENKYNMSY